MRDAGDLLPVVVERLPDLFRMRRRAPAVRNLRGHPLGRRFAQRHPEAVPIYAARLVPLSTILDLLRVRAVAGVHHRRRRP